MTSEPSCDPADNVTRSLLGYGAIAGPVYLASGLIQGLTREGFDLTRHSLSLLSNGQYGWIQTATFALTGAMTIAASVGLSRARTGSRVGPWLVGVYGAGLMAAAVFSADPMDGFPVGTPPGPPVVTTTHGLLHFVVAGIGFFGIVAACLLFARLFERSHRRGLAAFSLMAGLLFLAGFMGLASGSKSPFAILAFWIGITAAWGWLAAVSTHFYRETRNRPAAA